MQVSVVLFSGGSAALASAYILGPRIGRYSKGTDPLPMGSPVNACMGLFVLWWGWLAFNSGSTYGVSGAKWQYAARAAVMTMMGSFGGGSFATIYSMYMCDGKVDIVHLINGILGSLVSITAGCFLYRAWEAILIGAIGSFLTCVSMPIIDRFGIDDPVGASAVHGVSGIWGVVAVGLFADNPIPLGTTNGRQGLFKGGGWYLLGVQVLSATALALWGLITTYLLLFCIDKIVPIRMDANEELLGADLMEHRIRHGQIGISRALSALAPLHLDISEAKDIPTVGVNPGHEKHLEEITAAARKLDQWRQLEDRMAESGKLRGRKPLFSVRQQSKVVNGSKEVSGTNSANGKFNQKIGDGKLDSKNDSELGGYTNYAWID